VNELKKDVQEYVLDQLEDDKEYLIEEYGCDLHNYLCNTNYFIIGTYKAKKWLGNFIFEAIEKIKEYEDFNFGQVTTPLDDPEKVANMLAYILGEEILSKSDHLNKYAWDRKLNSYSLEIITSQIKN
jgi:uncharacterized protein YuzB (UPF0349 family)